MQKLRSLTPSEMIGAAICQHSLGIPLSRYYSNDSLLNERHIVYLSPGIILPVLGGSKKSINRWADFADTAKPVFDAQVRKNLLILEAFAHAELFDRFLKQPYGQGLEDVWLIAGSATPIRNAAREFAINSNPVDAVHAATEMFRFAWDYDFGHDLFRSPVQFCRNLINDWSEIKFSQHELEHIETRW